VRADDAGRHDVVRCRVREDFSVTIAMDESGWERRRSLLQAKYEQIAWDLFAKHGFRDVTVEEIAEVSGVSARTLFRYFPVKEDFLLGFTRRGLQTLVNLIAELEPSPDPVRSVWQLIRTHSLQDPQDVRLLTLWRRAASDAPEIHARVRGERMQALTEAVTDYCAKSKGDAAAEDPEPRVLAGVVVGAEMAVIELWGRSGLGLHEIFEAAEAAVPDLAQKRRGRRP
jgi:AcrR family transcriptional regulator